MKVIDSGVPVKGSRKALGQLWGTIGIHCSPSLLRDPTESNHQG